MSSSNSLDPNKPDLCKILRDVSLGGFTPSRGYHCRGIQLFCQSQVTSWSTYDLNMRRKAETLKHENTSENYKLSKKERYKLAVTGKLSKKKCSFATGGINSQSNPNLLSLPLNNGILSVPTTNENIPLHPSASGLPGGYRPGVCGPTYTLYYNPAVPLTNYIVNRTFGTGPNVTPWAPNETPCPPENLHAIFIYPRNDMVTNYDPMVMSGGPENPWKFRQTPPKADLPWPDWLSPVKINPIDQEWNNINSYNLDKWQSGTAAPGDNGPKTPAHAWTNRTSSAFGISITFESDDPAVKWQSAYYSAGYEGPVPEPPPPLCVAPTEQLFDISATNFSRNNLWYAVTWDVANDSGVCGVSHYERHVTLQYESRAQASVKPFAISVSGWDILQQWITTTHVVDNPVRDPSINTTFPPIPNSTTETMRDSENTLGSTNDLSHSFLWPTIAPGSSGGAYIQTGQTATKNQDYWTTQDIYLNLESSTYTYNTNPEKVNQNLQYYTEIRGPYYITYKVRAVSNCNTYSAWSLPTTLGPIDIPKDPTTIDDFIFNVEDVILSPPPNVLKITFSQILKGDCQFPSQQDPTGDWSNYTWWCKGGVAQPHVDRLRADCSYQLDWSGGAVPGWQTIIPEMSSRSLPPGPDIVYPLPNPITGGIIEVTTTGIIADRLYDFSLCITNPIGSRCYHHQYTTKKNVPLPPLFVFVP